MSVMGGQCVAQSRTKQFCKEASKRGLSWEQKKTEGNVLRCGLGVQQECKVIRAHAHSGMKTENGDSGPSKSLRGHQTMQGQEALWPSVRATFNLPPSRGIIGFMSLPAPLSSPDLHPGLEGLCQAPL